ncbi:hypothetical protein BDM02DRAFT_3090662 [Thelephora ganbajun]|uniref:Uncharacterized protein n=1 Tax=Thelephora ganbajun TaxID=370292 RepID=A0ACB6ZRM4_THEGA|nr:hypothetical protein BDM02DRAFT_3090662 [Thelephora ganbajun]
MSLNGDPLDEDYVRTRLKQPPFVTIDGVLNIRDLGSYPTADPSLIIKPSFMYRSGEVSGITGEGKSQLKSLGITHIFDLRSDPEMAKWQSPIPQIDGVEVIHAPVFKNEDYSPEMMAKKFKLYSTNKTEAFMELYTQIMDNAGPSFRTILRHIRDNPNSSCIFHCTAGKDRTGILAALLLNLAGVDDQIIAEDYALTRVGREPAREKIMTRLREEPLFASNNEAALNMFSCRPDTMLAFLSLLKERYGGVEGYLKDVIQLTDGDISTIRSNILAPRTS